LLFPGDLGSRSEKTDETGETLYSDTRDEAFGEEVKRRIILGTYTLTEGYASVSLCSKIWFNLHLE
jgi:aspartyl-tRNA(Asn)/glutamyl-tRNA(Gln) amidotransferase subunit A